MEREVEMGNIQVQRESTDFNFAENMLDLKYLLNMERKKANNFSE